MRNVYEMAKRAAALLLTIIFLTSSPALAHENHDQLGAGPGPSAEAQVEAKAAVAAPAQMANMHEDAAAAHEGAMEHHVAAADANKTFSQRLVSWLGRVHSLAVHFPIAMFVGAFFVELFALRRPEQDLGRAVQVMLAVGAIGAVVAAGLGWFAGGFYLTDRNPILMVHRWLGTGIAIFGIALLYFSATARRAPDRPRRAYWGTLGLMTVAIAIQGFLGGTFMHGGINHMRF